MASWVLCRGLGKTLDEITVTIPHDLYVFGTQENSVCDREWVESLRVILKEQTELDYKPVREQQELTGLFISSKEKNNEVDAFETEICLCGLKEDESLLIVSICFVRLRCRLCGT